MTERSTLGDGLSSGVTLPIFPRYPQNSSTAVRGLNNSSPMRPSPLRETLTVPSTEDMKIKETPDAALVDNDQKTHIMKTTANDITPPDSVNAKTPVIVDGSCTAAESPTYTTVSNFCVDQQGIEDPFISPAPQRANRSENPTTPSQNSVVARIYANISVPKGNGFSPRPDRLGQQITAANAQGILPPEALIFVANLSNQKSDDQLEVSCHQAFDTFGKCHVKVKRDRNNQPYAFIQFEQIEDADMALVEARGLKIDGRACRTERAKAARSVVLARVAGGNVTEEEARNIMEPFGPIANLMPVTVRDQKELGMPAGGLWVKFAFFQDFKDATWNFKESDSHRLYIPPADLSPMRPFNNISPAGGCGPHIPSDMRSVFVGNLPEEVCEDQLRYLLAPYGTVDYLTIIRKQGPQGGMNVFAFVQFRTPEEAEAAMQIETIVGDRKIRVELKRYNPRRDPRNMAHPMQAVPSRPNPAILQAVHNYALQLGLSPQHALAILNIGQGYPAAIASPGFEYQIGYQGGHMV